MATTPHTASNYVAVFILFTNDHGSAAIYTSCRKIILVVHTTAFNIPTFIAAFIRSNPDARAFRSNTKLDLSE
ncbi:hypothetical protein AA309_00795 [Microvirga vignae]|uniref:Uncharacterized protein n=1 Tax=Microvirga vignae TaxID=1225564 RepID=A0A0H1RQS1_9HYPH|nr:hypothetical protein AA309_00795 [Microvirga vignae]